MASASSLAVWSFPSARWSSSAAARRRRFSSRRAWTPAPVSVSSCWSRSRSVCPEAMVFAPAFRLPQSPVYRVPGRGSAPDGPARDLLDGVAQHLGGHGLGEMQGEAGFPALADVLL